MNNLNSTLATLHLKRALVTMSQKSAPQLYAEGFYYRANGIHEEAAHDHEPDFVTITKLEKRRHIKTKASNSDEPPRKILSQFVNQFDDETATANYPSYEADRQVINRVKSKLKPNYPPTPETLADITLPDFLKFKGSLSSQSLKKISAKAVSSFFMTQELRMSTVSFFSLHRPTLSY